MLNAEHGAAPLTNITSPPQDHIIITSVASFVVLVYAAVLCYYAHRVGKRIISGHTAAGSKFWNNFSLAADNQQTRGETTPVMPAPKGTAGEVRNATSPSSAKALQHAEQGAGVKGPSFA